MSVWYLNTSVYHIYITGFCNAPFMNDYNETVSRIKEVYKWIPHIKDMGFTSVLFSPIFQSRSHGYDTTDYFKIDNRFGTNQDFADLARTLHENGIKIILDGVFNHCGRDFFAFRDLLANKRGSAYCSWFSGMNFDRNNSYNDGFFYDAWAGYEELVKFNLQNPEVKQHIFEAIKFWVNTFDIDGLRLDAADVLDFSFMKELRSFSENLKRDFWLMGEVVHGDYKRWANEHTLHSVTNYTLFKGLYSSHNSQNLFEVASTIQREFSDLQSGISLYNFADNHDQNRLSSLLTKTEYLYTEYLMLFTLPGVPSVYYGSEWGIKGEKTAASDADVRPYIDIEHIQPEEPALEEHIKKLNHIRNNNEVLCLGSYRQVYIQYQKPLIYERNYNGKNAVIAVNIRDEEDTVDIRQFGRDFYDVLNDEHISAGSLQSLQIPPHWGRILL